MDDLVLYVIIGIVLLVALALVFSIVHIVREYERLVVFLFGRLQGASGPGIVLLILLERYLKSEYLSMFGRL